MANMVAGVELARKMDYANKKEDRVENQYKVLTSSDLESNQMVLRKGKKKYIKIIVK